MHSLFGVHLEWDGHPGSSGSAPPATTQSAAQCLYTDPLTWHLNQVPVWTLGYPKSYKYQNDIPQLVVLLWACSVHSFRKFPSEVRIILPTATIDAVENLANKSWPGHSQLRLIVEPFPHTIYPPCSVEREGIHLLLAVYRDMGDMRDGEVEQDGGDGGAGWYLSGVLLLQGYSIMEIVVLCRTA